MSSFAHTVHGGGVLPPPTLPALQQWRRQIGCRLAEGRSPRPLVLVTHRVRGRVDGDLVPTTRLTFFALFDERSDDGRLSTWVQGFGVTVAGKNIRIGEPSRVVKDLRLAPNRDGRGHHFETGRHGDLLEAALGWERHAERHSRHPFFPRRMIVRWPDWWCVVTDFRPGLTTRRHQGRTLATLEDVVRLEIPVTDVFADLTTLPKRQVLAADVPARVLCGTAGPVTFDLFHSRFRPAS